jgi:hypothetical protein
MQFARLVIIAVLMIGVIAPLKVRADVTDDIPVLQPDEQRAFERKAIAGDNDAAIQLAIRLRDSKQSDYWLTLAARRGDCSAIEQKFDGYRDSNLEAMKFWGEFAVRNHCPDGERLMADTRVAVFDNQHASLVGSARAGNCADLERLGELYRGNNIQPYPWVANVTRKKCSAPTSR